MNGDVVLPAFEMDCRDWLVATPADAGLPEDIDGAPLLALLSTAVVGRRALQAVSGVITVGLLDDEAPLAVPPLPGCPAAEIVESLSAQEPDDVAVRYIVPSPDGQLALLAEFTMEREHGPGNMSGAELSRRIEALMTSFRWAA